MGDLKIGYVTSQTDAQFLAFNENAVISPIVYGRIFAWIQAVTTPNLWTSKTNGLHLKAAFDF